MEDYTFDNDASIGSKQISTGSMEDLQISGGSTMLIGSTEWKHELILEIIDDQEWLNKLLSQCKALKDAITEDSPCLTEIHELLQTGELDDWAQATEQRMDIQVSNIANRVPFCRRLQAAVANRLTTFVPHYVCWN